MGPWTVAEMEVWMRVRIAQLQTVVAREICGLSGPTPRLREV